MNEVGYESFEFYHDELDHYLVPKEHLKKLPNPLLLETYTFVDENRNEWLVGYVRSEETRELMYEVWVKNGDPIAYEIHV